MTTHDRDAVIAAAKEAGITYSGTTPEIFDSQDMLTSFYATAFEAGRQAQLDAEFCCLDSTNTYLEVAKMQSNFSKSHEEMQLERIILADNDLPTAKAACVISDLADQHAALRKQEWLSRKLAVAAEPGGIMACEPSRLDTLNDELQLARQANEAQHQQLAAALDEARMANVSADEVRSTYAEEMRKLSKQLSNHINREVMLRGYLERLACLGNGDMHGNSIGNCIAQEALAATADLNGLILCHAVEVGWIGTGPMDGRCEFSESKPANSVMRDFNMKPLYSAWEPK